MVEPPMAIGGHGSLTSSRGDRLSIPLSAHHGRRAARAESSVDTAVMVDGVQLARRWEMFLDNPRYRSSQESSRASSASRVLEGGSCGRNRNTVRRAEGSRPRWVGGLVVGWWIGGLVTVGGLSSLTAREGMAHASVTPPGIPPSLDPVVAARPFGTVKSA